jgi:hypothetical protein
MQLPTHVSCINVSNIDVDASLLLTYSLLGLPFDRLCGLVIRVLGYRSRGPGFDSRRYQIF